MRNNTLERKVNYFYILKSLLIIFSLILLLVILVQLIDLYEEPSHKRKRKIRVNSHSSSNNSDFIIINSDDTYVKGVSKLYKKKKLFPKKQFLFNPH